MALRVSALALVAAAACSSKSEVKTNGSATEPVVPQKPTFSVFALAEVRGQIGPCGCTSDPLGDISRTSRMVEDARKDGPVLFVDAGSLLYSKDPIPAHLAAQEELKADLLAAVYKENLQVGALGLGPADMANGAGSLRLPRTVANVGGNLDFKGLQAGTVVQLGDAKVGVFGVIAEGAVKSLTVTDPIAAGKAAITDLKAKGAQVVIALVQASSKRDAVKLVRDIGSIDLSVAGLGALAPEPDRIDVEAEKVGDGWLVIPANRGQVVSRVDVTLRPGGTGPLIDAVGKGAAQARIEQLERQLQSLDTALAKFATDKTADPVFVKQKQAEREQVATEKKKLETQPLAVPAKGNYFTFEQIRVHKKLACSAPVRDRIKAYDKAAGEANVKAAAGKLPVPPPKGQASYVGNEACSDCHDEAFQFWKTTRHAHAWETLTERNQQFDYECTGCHVTGWDKPGGSNMAKTEGLVDVGCETCHGPGSIHVAKGGEEKPFAVVRVPKDDLCATQCHTKEHSDTFERIAYLRDITGPGHAPELRKSLGEGPTGQQLRSVALDKAGRELGEGCVK
jgi:hypothetical protein